MASRRKSEHSSEEERAKREQRADKILDAAAELMLRWGYSKTTLDDIVQLTGVAKGTIYLHWKTREDLFLALIRREYMRLIKDIQQRVASDPEGGTAHGIAKHSMLATMKNPLIKAILLQDSELLNAWMRKEYASATLAQQIAQSLALFELFRAHGAIREDIDIRKQVYMLDAITMGFLVLDRYMPDDFKYSDEEVTEMMAETVRRTFEPARSPDAQADEKTKQELANSFIASLERILALRNSVEQETRMTK
ncbi:MAG TPA: helix-turn-helix domain-containing protein [Ktedonobacteraceae bacterium]